MAETDKGILFEAARNDFTTFCEVMAYILVPDLVWSPYLNLLCAEVESIIVGDVRRLVINLPPRHLKTIVASVLGGAWALGKDPTKSILSVSHSNSLANEIAYQTRIIMSTAEYRRCFPGTKIKHDRSSVMDFSTTAGGSRLSGSFDTGLTGRGADLIIIDDPLSAQDANSEKERDKAINSFEQMIATRLNDPRSGAILAVGQRLHEKDLSGHLIASGGYRHLKLPFEAEEDERHEYRGGVFRRRQGEVLQPERYGPAEIEETKRSHASHIYATQFQQEPTAISSGAIRREDFLHYDPPAPPGKIVCSWDLAATANASSSYSVCLVFQYNEHASYLIDVFRGQEDYSSLKGIAFAVEVAYRPQFHLIEDASLGPALASDLKGYGANTLLIKTGAVSKIDRLLAQMNQIRGQRVVLPRSAPWLEKLLDELVTFPHGSRDDQVDALTQYLKWYGERMSEPPPTKYFSLGIQHGASRSARKQDMIIRATPMVAPSPTHGRRRRF